MDRRKKTYEELDFTDDFLFCKILTNHPDLCKELAELILGRKIGGIVTVERQVPVEITANGRCVLYEDFMKDEQNTVYNIEMQTTPAGRIGKRFRYYQGMIDLNSIERGAKFESLPKSYVIFICLQNPFPEMGFHRMTFASLCRENTELALGDEAEKVILTPQGTKQDVSEELQALLRYLTKHLPEDDFTRRLEEKVQEARDHQKWRLEYMTLLERDERMREEGRAEGREEGRAEGLQRGLLQERIRLICRSLKRGIGPAEIAEFAGMPMEEARALCAAAAPFAPDYPEEAVYEALVK